MTGPDRRSVHPDKWSQSLKTAVGLLLPAAAEIVLFWGPDFVAIYNDAFAPTVGDKHPRALGRPARENWAELWDDLRPLLQRVRDTGETVFAKDRPSTLSGTGILRRFTSTLAIRQCRMRRAPSGACCA